LHAAMTERARPDATVSRRDILSAVATAHVGGGRVSEVEGAADRLCAEVRAHGTGPSPVVSTSSTSGTQRFAVPAVSEAVRACGGELTRRSEQQELGHREREGRDAPPPVRSRPPRLIAGRRRGQQRGMER
jgi:hypothetical protein